MKKNCVNKIKVQIIHCFFNPEEITFFNELDVCNHKRKIVERIITTYLSLRFKHYAKLQNQEKEIVVFFKELCHFMRICFLYTKEVADYSWLTVRILASFFVYKTHIPIMWLIPLSNKSVHDMVHGHSPNLSPHYTIHPTLLPSLLLPCSP